MGSRSSRQVLPSAVRAIKKLPPEAKRRIQAVIELLADEPRPPAAKKLTARPEWRVRTGDYRVLYRIQDDVLTVVVVHAGHRREVYEK
ncbi:type II toxin-antitoxin system RelE/ParE family toxin [Microbacterium enclense]|uniref:Type II toxin-antitoxin system RelE/ParE family toxin n=1 Tax=Microbacterium enclense TaxID=993073 RepID=A0A3S3P784_9MICO|nr:type II toxin-antitoxin system RelE/ParE family toxin [Microbacterium enclense]RWR21954.1 type II toxin-antitoxin system RelE/ParE family toxin [Microbacterium enclense]